ncbi:MAG: hypothetical protein WA415_30030 [Mycobacterium sp.]
MHVSARPYVIAGSALLASSVMAVTPAMSPAAPRVANMDVRLVDVATDATSALGSIDPLSALGGLSLPDLGSLSLPDLGGLSLPDLGSLDLGSLFADGSLLNIPYNLFADVVNIPFYEAEALQEYAYALGPAGQPGGVLDWIPPGATVGDGGAVPVTGGLEYALGGTGSWYMESIGNTWGWDDGNWPQLDAISHFLLPFQFTEPIAEEVQGFAQSEFIDGAHIGCEFECANPLGYLGGWLHGDTPLTSLLSPGATFPTTVADTVDSGNPGYTNLFYLFDQLISPNSPSTVIWSGAPGAQINLLEPLQAIAGNLTASPSADPIQFPDLGSVFSNALTLGKDIANDFNPFVEGSFLWWGAPTDYSIPTAIAGTITDFTGIPNQFGFPADQTLGSEPLTGYTSNPLDLPGGFAQGLQYFLDGNGGTAGDGLLGYLNPEIYLQALNNDIGTLTNPNDLLAALPLVGYLGLGDNVSPLTTIAYGSLLGTFPTGYFSGPFDASTLLDSFNPASLLGGAVDPSTLTTDLSGLLGGALDPTTLTTDLSALVPNAGADLTSMLGGALDPSTLTTDLSALLPNVGADLTSMLGGGLATDLSSLLSSSAVNVVPDLALQLLTAI